MFGRNLMTSKKSGFAALTTVVAAGLLLTACFTANLSGKAKSTSVLQNGKSRELEIKSTDSLGTGIGSLSGKFKDAGTNIAFPYGVSLSFYKGTTFGFGFNCSETTSTTSSSTTSSSTTSSSTTSSSTTSSSTTTEVTTIPPPGPQRRVHTRPAGGSSFEDLCTMPGTENARVWLGLVTYSSADRRVPNVTLPECAELYYYYIHGGFGPGAPTKAQLASVKTQALKDPASKKAITGFGEIVIIDTNHDGTPGPTDGYGFATICGPYTDLDPSGFSDRPIDSRYESLGYSYATCPEGAFDAPGGVYPTELAWDGGPEAVAEMLLTECGNNITSGNLKISIATDFGAGSGPFGSGPIGPN